MLIPLTKLIRELALNRVIITVSPDPENQERVHVVTQIDSGETPANAKPDTLEIRAKLAIPFILSGAPDEIAQAYGREVAEYMHSVIPVKLGRFAATF